MIIVSAGALGTSGYLARLRERRGTAGRPLPIDEPRSRLSDIAVYSMLAMFFFGLAIATSAPLVPEVDGTVVDLRSGKGNQFSIVVETSRGRYDVVGDPDAHDRCPKRSRIVKRSWTMAYSCDGSPAGAARVGIFLAIALEALVGVVVVGAAVLRPSK